MKNPFLIGDRIYLRPLEPEDAEIIVPWFNDAEVTRYLLIARPMSLDGEREFLRQLTKNEQDMILGIVLKPDDRLIGTVGLHRLDVRNRHAEFGISIGDKGEWGRGYGTEATSLVVDYAFETRNLNRVWLRVYEYNVRGIRCYEKLGFRREGIQRQDQYREGRYWDTWFMGLLREEWGARRAGRGHATRTAPDPYSVPGQGAAPEV